ncbi:PadR family transcriptional regulator [Nocardia sp. CDC159]|uniref:PadR family transcriptional regulator n=1 Tax=Nocardia pulmonis TaxID=2951408 RepID=A0A9X2J0C6_9NOCA|nr:MULTISPECIES: PadR family transcriptional regulator [Nocardia]MCM6775811.1 PadR family transcriptional regulator [Nocardia pulmonis]MCM6788213.1 PadR family transcriptional regulator [Nocardia sp. CDC159]
MTVQPGALLTPLAISVLALLEERPMHPYEMYQTLLQRREDYLVKIRPGSLYHTVTRLAERGMVTAEGTDRAGNRPERTIYRITPGGTTALRARIADIIRRPVREYPLFPHAMSEAHNLPADEVIALLRDRIGRLENDRTELDVLHRWLTTHEVPRRYWMVLEYLRGQADAELVWLRRIVTELADGTLAWDDFAPDGTRMPAPTNAIGPDWGSAVTDDVLAELRKEERNA